MIFDTMGVAILHQEGTKSKQSLPKEALCLRKLMRTFGNGGLALICSWKSILEHLPKVMTKPLGFIKEF